MYRNKHYKEVKISTITTRPANRGYTSRYFGRPASLSYLIGKAGWAGDRFENWWFMARSESVYMGRLGLAVILPLSRGIGVEAVKILVTSQVFGGITSASIANHINFRRWIQTTTRAAVMCEQCVSYGNFRNCRGQRGGALMSERETLT
ncbi:hypothetical protein J6590_061840 [Homalodisca vitripennis]|nr:hypothetical protein J6590_061840 [Homalodisca vitripennis]